MKIQYLLIPVLLCVSTVLSGCISAGYHSSNVKTCEGQALNKAVYLDFFGHGRQVYPASVAESVPVYYQDTVSTSYGGSYPVYSGGYSGGYSGSYYGRSVTPIDHRDHYTPQHNYQPRHVEPQPRVWHQPQPHVYRVPPPYILPPSGSVTVVTPTYGTQAPRNVLPPSGSVTVVQPTYRRGPR